MNICQNLIGYEMSVVNVMWRRLVTGQDEDVGKHETTLENVSWRPLGVVKISINRDRH